MPSATKPVQNLSIYLPSNTISDAVLQQFTQQTGVVVTTHTYPMSALTNEGFTQPKDVDIALLPYSQYPDTSALNDHFKPIDTTKLPNIERINPVLDTAELRPYINNSVPLLIQGIGIATNSKMLSPSLFSHWSDLHDEQWTGQLLIMDDAQTLVSIALIELGYPVNNANSQQLQKAKQWLLDKKTNVAFFSKSQPETHFLSGQVVVGTLSNDRVYRGNLENADITLVWPMEGAVLDLFALSIMQHSHSQQAALQLINYLLSAPIQTSLALTTGLTPSTVGQSTQSPFLQRLPSEVIAGGHFKLNSPATRLKQQRILDEIQQ
ncbi:ABC transporter substrate-binding protein [Vibrio rarus]|uniref:ABC transporter substrate-binding protein n=1 Tax=Vibrio rarus TaxID=413403 RepID=UPI0021C31E7B|nr:extracellular solute-binding protein [Vibrio rarus]